MNCANAILRFDVLSQPSSPAPELDIGEERIFEHEKLKWLKDGQRKDKYGKLHTHPDYDGRTLHVSQFCFQVDFISFVIEWKM